MRKRWAHAFSLAVGLAAVLALGSWAADGGQARSEIEAANKRFAAAFERGDAAELAGFYSAGARVFPPNTEIVSGKEAIQRFWQGLIDTGVKQIALTTLDAEAHGDLAYEVGLYTLKAADGKVVDSGKYVVVWKRENKQWKLQCDIWNTNLSSPQ